MCCGGAGGCQESGPAISSICALLSEGSAVGPPAMTDRCRAPGTGGSSAHRSWLSQLAGYGIHFGSGSNRNRARPARMTSGFSRLIADRHACSALRLASLRGYAAQNRSNSSSPVAVVGLPFLVAAVPVSTGKTEVLLTEEDLGTEP